jgi:RNA polymerase sigma factor (sigma-70 family)
MTVWKRQPGPSFSAIHGFRKTLPKVSGMNGYPDSAAFRLRAVAPRKKSSGRVGIEVVAEQRQTEFTEDHAAAAPGADPLAALIAGEDDRRLWRSVAALPSGERTAAILYYREDLSVQQIAFALGVTAGTVKTLLFRARRRLRHTLGGLPPVKDSR